MAGGLKEVRNRIASVGSTRQITQAMKVVSAAKLRRAQDAITQMRPYAERLQEILVNVSGSMEGSENPYAIEREVKKVLLVAITSNRGLCGPFNNNVIKLAKGRIDEHTEARVHVLCLGKKAGDAFRKTDHFTTLTLGAEAFGTPRPGNRNKSSIKGCCSPVLFLLFLLFAVFSFRRFLFVRCFLLLAGCGALFLFVPRFFFGRFFFRRVCSIPGVLSLPPHQSPYPIKTMSKPYPNPIQTVSKPSSSRTRI